MKTFFFIKLSLVHFPELESRNLMIWKSIEEDCQLHAVTKSMVIVLYWAHEINDKKIAENLQGFLETKSYKVELNRFVREPAESSFTLENLVKQRIRVSEMKHKGNNKDKSGEAPVLCIFIDKDVQNFSVGITKKEYLF